VLANEPVSMYGTAAAVRAWTTLPMTVSAPSPEPIQFPEELVLNSRVVKVRMALSDSCASDGSDGVAHLAGDQNPARTTEPAVNLRLNSGCFRQRPSGSGPELGSARRTPFHKACDATHSTIAEKRS
jgi:hypothetical protein